MVIAKSSYAFKLNDSINTNMLNKIISRSQPICDLTREWYNWASFSVSLVVGKHKPVVLYTERTDTNQKQRKARKQIPNMSSRSSGLWLPLPWS